MADPTNQLINTGSFVPTTNIWDPSEIYETDVNSDDFKELLVRLYQNLNLMANVLNSKTTGYYITNQIATSNLYFNPKTNDILELRGGFRATIDTGALAAGVNTITLPFTIPTAPSLDTLPYWTFFLVGGSATNTVTTPLVYSLPFPSADGLHNIEVIVNASTIVITNNSGVTFEKSNITLEFVKN